MAVTTSLRVLRIMGWAAAVVWLALELSGSGQFAMSAAAQTAVPTPGAPVFPPAFYDESLRDLKYYR